MATELRRPALTDAEHAELGEFLTWVRRQWKDRAPDGRRQFERCLKDAAAGYGMERVNALRAQDLARRLDEVRDENGAERAALARAGALLNVQRKTLRMDDLRAALDPGTVPRG